MTNQIPLAQRRSATPIFLEWSISTLAALLILGPLTLNIGIPLYQILLSAIIAFTILAATLHAASAIIQRQCTWYEITATQLRTRRGILTKIERTIPLVAIQSTTIKWPLVGRLLNYGTIRIELIGNYPSILFLIDNPTTWQHALMNSNTLNPFHIQTDRPTSPFA
jgi:uncharacterized membrane protein YdbT with pleckstrin-like domain